MVAGGLGVVAITAAATLLPSPPTPTPQPPPLPATVPASGIAGPDGVFASGTVDGHAWRLAVQDIADPGYRCIPAITVNGTDADLLFPDPGDGADVAIGAAAPGIGFAFVQVPDGIDGLIVNGQESVPAIEVTVCGQHYRLVGLAYRLKHPPRLTAQYAGPDSPKTKRSTEGGSPDWRAVYPLPLISIQPPGVAGPQAYGLWNHVRPVSPKPTRALLASGKAWSIELIFGVAGDCYELNSYPTGVLLGRNRRYDYGKYEIEEKPDLPRHRREQPQGALQLHDQGNVEAGLVLKGPEVKACATAVPR